MPHLLTLYNKCLSTNSFPPSFYKANVVLLTKPDKDPLLCASYRPIAPLSMDLKILAKMLASRLTKVLHYLVSPDQTGFMPQKPTDINLRRVFTHDELHPDSPDEQVLVFLDLEKALDSVDWQYMQAVLQHMGFGEVFLHWVRLLYDHPTAAIKLNGRLSESFPVGHGTRQGFPLSPGLFALMMQPIAVALRASSLVEGITMGNLVEKKVLYADDVVLFLDYPATSLPQAILDHVSTFSGLRVNWHKSTIFPLGKDVCQAAFASTPLQKVSRVKYLGLTITNSVSDYFRQNVAPVISIFRQKIGIRQNLPLSLIGRVNLIKMKLLPLLLYTLKKLARMDPQINL